MMYKDIIFIDYYSILGQLCADYRVINLDLWNDDTSRTWIRRVLASNGRRDHPVPQEIFSSIGVLR